MEEQAVGAGPGVDVVVRKAVPAAVAARRLRAVLLAALGLPELAARLPAGRSALTVRVTGDRELRRLNRTYLGEDLPTDVLSFPGGGGEAAYLGDIAVSWPAAQRQGLALGHGAEAELAFLVVHGLLHLLGWDHASRLEAAEMDRLAAAALAAAGLPRVRGRL